MLSGIGPKKHLEEHNIKVVQDLPGVGQNLTDHLFAPIYFKAKKDTPSKPEWCAVVGYGRSDGDYSEHVVPDYQYLLSARKEWLPGFPRAPGTAETDNSPQIVGAIAIMHPKSHGTITLASNDPSVHPIIDPNYLQHKEEVQVFVDGAGQLRSLLRTSAMSEWVDCELVPGKLSLEEEHAHWRSVCASQWHPVGTCRMGSDTDARSVVNPRLQVLHMKNLRVIDASVMPEVPSGNTHAPTLAVADRGADIILEDWESITRPTQVNRAKF